MMIKNKLTFLRANCKFIYERNINSIYNNVVTLKKDDFYDHQNIFKFKTTWELYRSSILLKLCSFNWIVDNSMKVNTNKY